MKASDILIVEDNRLAAYALADLADLAEGVTVTLAFSGEQALVSLRERRFTLALLDYSLPDMQGVDVFRRMRREGLTTPVLLMTGFSVEHLFTGVAAGGGAKLLDIAAEPAAIAEALAAGERTSILAVPRPSGDFRSALASELAARGRRPVLVREPADGLRPEPEGDVVVVDMPGCILDYLVLCQDLAEQGGERPVIFLVAPAPGAPSGLGFDWSAALSYLSKPVDPATVLRKIEQSRRQPP